MDRTISPKPTMQFSELVNTSKTSKKNDNNDKNGQKFNLMRFIPSTKLSFFLILVLQVVIIILAVRPLDLYSNYRTFQVQNEVAKFANVPPQEIPQVSVIGDNNLPKAEDLRKLNEVTAYIYKDAQDGDYVLLYSTKLVIFRSSQNRIIYDGETPTTLAQKANQNLINQLSKKLIALNLLSADSKDAPQFQSITDLETIKKNNPEFYKDAAISDIVAIYPPQDGESLIVIYRPSTDEVVNYGKSVIKIN